MLIYHVNAKKVLKILSAAVFPWPDVTYPWPFSAPLVVLDGGTYHSSFELSIIGLRLNPERGLNPLMPLLEMSLSRVDQYEPHLFLFIGGFRGLPYGLQKRNIYRCIGFVKQHKILDIN